MQKMVWLIMLAIVSAVGACSKEAGKQPETFEGFVQPSNFPQAVYKFADNQVTKAGFELGRKLFYDPLLSGNNTISCGSCHLQTSAFTQHGHSVSHGIFDRLGTRNSPPIMNLAWSDSFMWDGGVFNLDLQPIAPITSHVEMDDTVSHVLDKLRASSTYPTMFQKAFGTAEVTSARFLKALSQFMVMCVSSNSKYDSVQRGQAGFSEVEQQGYAIFKQKCSACHREPLFTDHSFRNNGLSISSVNDQGRYLVTLMDSDRYKFRVPSLRNLDFTAPYMHDGRFFTVDAVLDHYTSQVERTLNLDPQFQQNDQPGIALSSDDKSSLLVFLKTLNDRRFVTDSRLAEQ